MVVMAVARRRHKHRQPRRSSPSRRGLPRSIADLPPPPFKFRYTLQMEAGRIGPAAAGGIRRSSRQRERNGSRHGNAGQSNQHDCPRDHQNRHDTAGRAISRGTGRPSIRSNQDGSTVDGPGGHAADGDGGTNQARSVEAVTASTKRQRPRTRRKLTVKRRRRRDAVEAVGDVPGAAGVLLQPPGVAGQVIQGAGVAMEFHVFHDVSQPVVDREYGSG